ncbi:MAG: type II toxin-antitoxin system RelE/ParE family toxin [Candidatus Hydrogenedentes bacterium]|nr:type II toxin-antitoxin system RelE/ParE family toxin [Candidatus Hydrogenedentota bacterium]
MRNVRFSKKARRDLDAICRYIARDNPSAAATVLEDVYRVCSLIGENPRLGRLRADAGENVRYFPISNLNIFYAVKGRDVHVVRVLHGRRGLWRALHYD